MQRQIVTFVFVVAVTAGGTLAHGYVTGRWSDRAAPSEYVLPEVPKAFGDWRGEDLKSGLADDKHLRNITRRYTHARSGRTFTFSLTLGPAGLTAQHTPEYCYPGSGYKSAGATQNFTVPGRTDADGSLRTAVFRKDMRGVSEGLRIFWAWSADGKWVAPKYPELKFLGGIALYKLYIVSGDAEKPVEDDAEAKDFLKQVIAGLQGPLFASRVEQVTK